MKKFVSILLAFVMVFTMALPAFAADASEKADYNGDPVVVVRGIHFTGLERADGSDAIVFSANDIQTLIIEYIVGKLAGDSSALADSLISFLQKAFGPIACDNEGNPVYPDVHMEKYPLSMDNYNVSESWSGGEEGLVYSVIQEIGGENTFYFTYDWRKNPLDLADELGEFIESVKKQTGKTKVDLAPCSMGGMVATAYLYKYGSDSVDSITFLSSAHNGTYIAGDALTGDIIFNGEILADFVADMTKNQNFLVKALLWVADLFGIFDFAATYLNGFVAGNKEKVYDELLRDYLGTSLGLWGLCCDEDFDKSVEYIFGDCKDEYPVIVSKLQDIKTFVCSTEKIISDADKNGVKISFVSHYGLMLLPIYGESDEHGDTVLESELTSNYATFAKFGETLSAEYLASADANYISPDKIVDASTSLYKDRTWFIKNADHVGCDINSDHAKLALWLITSETQPTIVSDQRYPQFITVDENMNFVK